MFIHHYIRQIKDNIDKFCWSVLTRKLPMYVFTVNKWNNGFIIVKDFITWQYINRETIAINKQLSNYIMLVWASSYCTHLNQLFHHLTCEQLSNITPNITLFTFDNFYFSLPREDQPSCILTISNLKTSNSFIGEYSFSSGLQWVRWRQRRKRKVWQRKTSCGQSQFILRDCTLTQICIC